MILECDIGNTNCKWRLSDGGSIVGRGVFAYAGGFDLLPDLSLVSRVRTACVAAEGARLAFAEQLKVYGLSSEYATSQTVVEGMNSTYRKVAQLGVDRWLAVVAAYKRGGAALVIDVGSALNIELVSAQGSYLGGYIIPGEKLMHNALLAGTGQVRFESTDAGYDGGFGRSTAEAVGGGVRAALSGACYIAIEQARRRLSEEFAILLTGGGAEEIKPSLVGEAEVVPELVLDGLRVLLP